MLCVYSGESRYLRGVLRPQTIPNRKEPLRGRGNGGGTSLLYSTKGISEDKPRYRRATAQAKVPVYRILCQAVGCGGEEFGYVVGEGRENIPLHC